MPESSAPRTLHELVSQTNDDGKNRKTVGYSISSYAGVLSALEKANIISGGGNDAVMGVRRPDFSKVAEMIYDNSGFSNDLTSGIWKMALTFHGAAPIKQTAEAWYDIVKFPGESIEKAKNMGVDRKVCPYFLSQESLDWVTTEDFSVGAHIDLCNLGVKYFNHFYANGLTNFYKQGVIEELVRSGYMVAQIIFPQKNTYKIVKILGQTSISKCATITLNSSLLACQGWEDLGINIRVTQNGRNPVQFMPNGTEYVHPCQGQIYYSSSGNIGNFNRSNFKERWLSYSMPNVVSVDSQRVTLEMELPRMGECFVRLFIPNEYKNEALRIIGTPPNEHIFQEYPGKLEYIQGSVAEFTGNVASRIAGTVNKWATVGQTKAMGSGTNKIYYTTNTSFRPFQFVRGNGPTYISASLPVPFKPMFGHPQNLNALDCSSFISMIIWDSGVVRDDVNTVPAFNSDSFCSPSIVQNINKYLKPEYEAKYIDLIDGSQVQSGDILCITKEERLRFHNEHRNYGHVAIACPEGDIQHTVEIGITTNASGTKKSGRPYTYYKHIIRIVEKQTT